MLKRNQTIFLVFTNGEVDIYGNPKFRYLEGLIMELKQKNFNIIYGLIPSNFLSLITLIFINPTLFLYSVSSLILIDKNLKNPFLKFWSFYIQKLKPFFIIGADPPEDLCKIAKEQNFQIINYQHGMIGSYPAQYLSFERLKNLSSTYMPNRHWVYNDLYKKCVKESLLDHKEIKIKIVGDLYHKHKKSSLNSEDLKNIKFLNNKIGANKSILILMQHSIDKNSPHLLVNPEYPFIYLPIIDYVKKNKDIFFMFKQHPKNLGTEEHKKFIQALKNMSKDQEQNFDLNATSKLPLSAFKLINVDFAISQNSASVIDLWCQAKIKAFLVDWKLKETGMDGKAFIEAENRGWLNIFSGPQHKWDEEFEKFFKGAA